MKQLTKAEEQVMQYLWNLDLAFLKDLVESFPEPRPAYTTISTVIRVLVKKGFIAFNTYGKIHQYYPKIRKEEYLKGQFDVVVQDYFSGSVAKFASFLTRDEDLNIDDLEEIRSMIDDQISKKKKD
ncbi:MAG: BlaI/MecI/CopY family transcriptional regulator [Bacteroidetes bacterium]|jgi:BlaI family transcriptional regulator, penicillinase repressor|nr:BlaI/MecI/CopY family transcriptional regulator [Bacteroidota bacterium]MBT3748692.1 BlaI/MecI/CopY family transcriptional regulator [Bacteroidota bacterium]MBT4398925.1 BlaI/MecI/CopY family transcriptional regulator [Bacteroidota bacterium]MBT4410091.1 BlaI/MecI/CopY family transcriptional regulator [Bacteroidota bacterium]MBT5428190.1 BlaI/MecI/CopY family transcriptional regulator [Bacteroidota bacterium]